MYDYEYEGRLALCLSHFIVYMKTVINIRQENPRNWKGKKKAQTSKAIKIHPWWNPEVQLETLIVVEEWGGFSEEQARKEEKWFPLRS